MGFLDPIIQFLQGLGSEILAVLVYLFQLIIIVFQFIWQFLVLIGNFFFTLMQDVGNFFVHLWTSFFKGIFTAVFNGIVKFGQWLSNIFGPVVKFLTKVSQFITRIYRAYIMPILRIIRIARVFLTLLRALGIKWAVKLDQILGTIQADIQRAFLLIRGYLNVIIDLLNILSDPSNLLRRPTSLLSIMRVWHAAIRMFTGLPPAFFMPALGASQPLGVGGLPKHFNPSDPLQNPPASYYLAFDGGVPDYSFLGPGDTIADDAPDTLQPAAYFTDDYRQLGDCVDPVACLTQAALLRLTAK